MLICSNTFIKTGRATRRAKENSYGLHFQQNQLEKLPQIPEYKLVQHLPEEEKLVVGFYLLVCLFVVLIPRALNADIANKCPRRREATVSGILSKWIKEQTETQGSVEAIKKHNINQKPKSLEVILLNKSVIRRVDKAQDRLKRRGNKKRERSFIQQWVENCKNNQTSQQYSVLFPSSGKSGCQASMASPSHPQKSRPLFFCSTRFSVDCR